jgi:hypothetical protein
MRSANDEPAKGVAASAAPPGSATHTLALGPRLLPVVHRDVVELLPVCMRALQGDSQRLAVFRHRAGPGTDGRSRFYLGDVGCRRIDPCEGYHIKVRIAADRIGFAIVLDVCSRRGFLAVCRHRFDGHGHALCRFSVSACLAFGRRAWRERRFRNVQLPRPNDSVGSKRRACADCKDDAESESFG